MIKTKKQADLKEKVSPFISLDNVTLSINGTILFQNLNWIIGSGEHWAITGPNGSGKSLLGQALCREIPISEGKILYFFDNSAGTAFFNKGEIILISPRVHQELGRRYSGYHQARWQSFEGTDAPEVGEFLSGKSIEHRSPYEVTPLRTNEAVYLERRAKAVALLKIDYLLDRKIIHLSHGETRKVMLARALMQSPKLLILDDPFSGLDRDSREILITVIKAITSGATPQILLITSNPTEIPPGITHLLSIDESGKIKKGPISPLHTPAAPTLSSHRTSRPISFPAVFPELQTPFLTESLKSPSNQILLELRNVSVNYGKVKVLRNLNWTVRQGEHWALLGHNGAGKTTLLSLILGDNPQAYANDIKLFGKERGSGESIWDIKRQIGWVSPELQIHSYQNLTCYETVCSGFFDSLGLYRECTTQQADMAGYWLRLFSVSGLADRPFNTVSMGEQRLVLLARALVKKPVLLVLDEPCHGLDTSHRRNILNLLDLVCQQSAISIIYVTHILDELPQEITHLLELRRGQIVACGPRKILC